jgi:two-component system, LytTR family, response regulator
MDKQQQVTAIIVDDDPLSSMHLHQLLLKNAKEVSVQLVCNQPAEALYKIKELKPKLVFLDVEMPGMTGFELLKQIPEKDFEVIFISSHDHYAIRAIRFAALDYILKPVDPTALQEAVGRAIEKIRLSEKNDENFQFTPAGKDDKPLDLLAIPTMDGLVFEKPNEIIYCEASDKYTKIFFNGQKKQMLSSKTLGDFEDVLLASGFYRIHHSYLVNLNHLQRYIKGEGGQVVMSNGTTLDVSRRKKDKLLQLVSRF